MPVANLECQTLHKGKTKWMWAKRRTNLGQNAVWRKPHKKEKGRNVAGTNFLLWHGPNRPFPVLLTERNTNTFGCLSVVQLILLITGYRNSPTLTFHREVETPSQNCSPSLARTKMRCGDKGSHHSPVVSKRHRFFIFEDSGLLFMWEGFPSKHDMAGTHRQPML